MPYVSLEERRCPVIPLPEEPLHIADAFNDTITRNEFLGVYNQYNPQECVQRSRVNSGNGQYIRIEDDFYPNASLPLEKPVSGTPAGKMPVELDARTPASAVWNFPGSNDGRLFSNTERIPGSSAAFTLEQAMNGWRRRMGVESSTLSPNLSFTMQSGSEYTFPGMLDVDPHTFVIQSPFSQAEICEVGYGVVLASDDLEKTLLRKNGDFCFVSIFPKDDIHNQLGYLCAVRKKLGRVNSRYEVITKAHDIFPLFQEMNEEFSDTQQEILHSIEHLDWSHDSITYLLFIVEKIAVQDKDLITSHAEPIFLMLQEKVRHGEELMMEEEILLKDLTVWRNSSENFGYYVFLCKLLRNAYKIDYLEEIKGKMKTAINQVDKKIEHMTAIQVLFQSYTASLK